MKNIALCLSGHFRNFSKCYPTLKTHILDVYNPTIFISTWSESGLWSCTETVERGGVVDLESVKSILIPRRFIVENYDDVKTIFIEKEKLITNKIYYTRPENTFSMYYKVKSVLSECFSYEKETGTSFDFIIRTRPDIFYNGGLSNIDPNKFNVCNSISTTDGYGDILQCSNANYMRMFNVYDDIIKVKDNIVWCPHNLIKYYCNNTIGCDNVNLFYPNIKLLNSKSGYCNQG